MRVKQIKSTQVNRKCLARRAQDAPTPMPTRPRGCNCKEADQGQAEECEQMGDVQLGKGKPGMASKAVQMTLASVSPPSDRCLSAERVPGCLTITHGSALTHYSSLGDLLVFKGTDGLIFRLPY